MNQTTLNNEKKWHFVGNKTYFSACLKNAVHIASTKTHKINF